MEKRKRREEERALKINNTTDDTITTTTTNRCLEWRSSRLEKEESSSSQRECETRETVERYSRQMRLPFFRHDERSKGGQSRLVNASVFIAGAGGLGCPSVLYLAGAGVGKITVCDADAVEKSNLHRQICHRNEDCCS